MFSIIWILIPITIYIQHSAQMIMRMISKWKRNHQKNDGTLLTKIYCRLNPYFILFTNSFILFIISFVFCWCFQRQEKWLRLRRSKKPTWIRRETARPQIHLATTTTIITTTAITTITVKVSHLFMTSGYKSKCKQHRWSVVRRFFD